MEKAAPMWIIRCSLLTYAVHWTFLVLSEIWNFLVEIFYHWILVRIHIWMFSAGCAYLIIFILFQGSVLKILISIVNAESLIKTVTSASSKSQLPAEIFCLWIVPPISPFRKYKVGCFLVGSTLLYRSIGMWQLSLWMNCSLSALEYSSFVAASREKNLIVISHSRNPGSYQQQPDNSFRNLIPVVWICKASELRFNGNCPMPLRLVQRRVKLLKSSLDRTSLSQIIGWFVMFWLDCTSCSVGCLFWCVYYI